MTNQVYSNGSNNDAWHYASLIPAIDGEVIGTYSSLRLSPIVRGIGVIDAKPARRQSPRAIHNLLYCIDLYCIDDPSSISLNLRHRLPCIPFVREPVLYGGILKKGKNEIHGKDGYGREFENSGVRQPRPGAFQHLLIGEYFSGDA